MAISFRVRGNPEQISVRHPRWLRIHQPLDGQSAHLRELVHKCDLLFHTQRGLPNYTQRYWFQLHLIRLRNTPCEWLQRPPDE